MTERDIFIGALREAEPAARAAFLHRACGGDGNIRGQVESLLREHEQLGGFLETAKNAYDTATFGATAADTPGTVIGPYKLLQRIGEGGMGTVYMAEQTQPVQRRVALKVIKPGMDSRQVIARFEAERQALAMMDHPNIARVFDGGVTQSPPAVSGGFAGRPYFVMELVHGVSITSYCDDHQLTLRERLELFGPVCQAIQHAHQKGIIHRDIKPSNVMVTLYDGKPAPKVIDFGVAKATEQRLTERTLCTQYGTLVGTLEYMSPEQAEMSALGVDTRSDIYSLGVLLYELLTGSTPISHKRLNEAAYAEALRMIKEEEPPKPSTRLSASGEALASISTQRHIEPAKLACVVRGDLDWIVMKCLEKDRNRRYENASALAADVQRYLADEPVQACPPSAGYRLRKFATRNKRALATAAAMVLAFLIAAGAFGWTMLDRTARRVKLNQEVDLALREADNLRERALPLTDDPYQWEAALAAALSALKRAEGLASHDDAAFEPAIGERLHESRAVLDADENDRRFVARFDEIRLEQTQADTVQSRYKEEIAFPAMRNALKEGYGIDFGTTPVSEVATLIQQRPKAIQEQVLAALDVSVAHVPAQEPRMRQWLIAVLEAADVDPWRKGARQALAAQDGPALEKLVQNAMAARQPPTFLLRLSYGLPRESDTTLKFLRQIQNAYPSDFWANLTLAGMLHYRKQPRLEEAIRYYTAAIAVRPRNPVAYVDLGNALGSRGQSDEAIAAYRRAIGISPNYSAAYRNLGIALKAGGDRQGADAAYLKSVEVAHDRAQAHFLLGVALYNEDHDVDGAIAAYREAIRVKPDFPAAHSNLGITLSRQGKLDEAIASLKKAVDLDPRFAAAHSNLGSALRRQKKLDEAIASFKKAIELDPKLVIAHIGLGLALGERGDLDAAEGAYREAICLEPNNENGHYNLGALLCDRIGDFDKAIVCFDQVIRLSPDHINAHICRGIALSKKGLVDEALACFDRAIGLKPDDVVARIQRGITLTSHRRWAEAISAYREAIRRKSDHAVAINNLGDLLANCPDLNLRDPAEAVSLARKAIELSPNEGAFWNTLGAGHYRTGDWKAAVTALHKSMELAKGGDSIDWFFLAMSHWQLSNKDEARTWYDKAVRGIDSNLSVIDDIRPLRAEAAKLLGIQETKK